MLSIIPTALTFIGHSIIYANAYIKIGSKNEQLKQVNTYFFALKYDNIIIGDHNG